MAQTRPAEAVKPTLICEHCGAEGTDDNPIVPRWERLRSHGRAIATARCGNEVACWKRWNQTHGASPA